MKKPLSKKLGSRPDNRGSGLVSVLIAVAFVAALGAAILYLSFMNYQIKVSDRASRANFYDTETAVSEIRAGLQAIATESIADAYTAVLTNYDAASSDANKDKFAEEFVSALSASAALSIELGTGVEAGDGSYDIAELLEFIRDDERSSVEISGNKLSFSYDDREVVLRDLSVTYKDEERGYKTTITTDILIKIPDFSYTLSDRSLGNLYNYIIVADEELLHITYDATVNGSIYAGNIRLEGGRELTLTNNSTITSGRTVLGAPGRAIDPDYGRVSIRNNSRLNVDGELWARQIELGTDTSGRSDWNLMISSGSTAHVADDLSVLGNNARVKIDGSYYGFGRQTDALTSGAENSSIIVSGNNTTLDFSDADNIHLAGFAFINANSSSGSYNSGQMDVPMGASVGVRTDQLAYLAPVELMTIDGNPAESNPFISNSGNVVSVEVDTAAPYLSVPTGSGTNDEYSLGDFGASVKPMYINLPSDPSNKLVYMFLEFDTPAHARDFQAAYYKANKADVDKYLNIYFNDIDLGSKAISSSGTYYTMGPDGFNLATGSGGVTFASQNTHYLNNITTLSISNFEQITPFNYYVNSTEINKVFETNTGPIEFHYVNGSGGKVVNALIIPRQYYTGNSTFVIDSSYSDVNVILAMGNVSVNRKFEGLIMSTGTVTLNADLSTEIEHSAGRSSTSAAFDAVTDVDGELRTLFSFMKDYSGAGAPAEGGDEISWDLDKLVVYKNWTKN